MPDLDLRHPACDRLLKELEDDRITVTEFWCKAFHILVGLYPRDEAHISGCVLEMVEIDNAR